MTIILYQLTKTIILSLYHHHSIIYCRTVLVLQRNLRLFVLHNSASLSIFLFFSTIVRQAQSRELQVERFSSWFYENISFSIGVSTRKHRWIYFLDEQDSTELDLIISELQDIKAEFDECSSNKNFIKKMNHQKSTSSSSKISDTNGCVHELRTLEDQLEAALASLTLTINDHIPNNLNCQQPRSCDSSASSSGVGEEISNDSFHLYNNNNNSTTLSKTTTIVDDADSAYSDSGSADKILLLSNHDESVRNRKRKISRREKLFFSFCLVQWRL